MLLKQSDELQKQIDIGQDKNGKTLTRKEIVRLRAKASKKISEIKHLKYTLSLEDRLSKMEEKVIEFADTLD